MKNQLYARPIPARSRQTEAPPRAAFTDSLIAAAEMIIGLTTTAAVFWLFAVIMFSR
jgi:hypothetical protein